MCVSSRQTLFLSISWTAVSCLQFLYVFFFFNDTATTEIYTYWTHSFPTRRSSDLLIVMDIQLPHISGLDVIRALKSNDAFKLIPVVAVTAFAGKGDDDRIRDEGADAYVSKPISVMRFIETVRQFV